MTNDDGFTTDLFRSLGDKAPGRMVWEYSDHGLLLVSDDGSVMVETTLTAAENLIDFIGNLGVTVAPIKQTSARNPNDDDD